MSEARKNGTSYTPQPQQELDQYLQNLATTRDSLETSLYTLTRRLHRIDLPSAQHVDYGQIQIVAQSMAQMLKLLEVCHALCTCMETPIHNYWKQPSPPLSPDSSTEK